MTASKRKKLELNLCNRSFESVFLNTLPILENIAILEIQFYFFTLFLFKILLVICNISYTFTIYLYKYTNAGKKLL